MNIGQIAVAVGDVGKALPFYREMPNKALQPTHPPCGRVFPRSLRSLGAAERRRWAAGMKALVGVLSLVLTACASAPVPQCIPPNLTRTPEASGPFGSVVPRTDNDTEEYARCKEREADDRLEAKLRKDEIEAKKREAEQLERELREMQEQGQEPTE